MSSIRSYTLIYVVLLVLATAKFVFHGMGLDESVFVGIIVVLAVMKSLIIAGYFQHLIDEPRSITYMMGTAVFMVFLLVAAAGYSIQ